MQAPQRIHCKIGSNSVPKALERPLSKITTQKSSGPSTSPATCLPEKVHISQPVVDLLGESHLHLTERTGVEVHGVEGRTYTIEV